MNEGHSAVTFSGAPGSPYTRKMLAVLRYRRIPYRYLVNNDQKNDLPVAKPALLPTFYFPDDDNRLKAVTDSTPLIRQLESLLDDRKVIPEKPVVAMLDSLLEDYFDEWLTKPMFHYRWSLDSDATRASRIVPLPMNHQVTDDFLAMVSKAFRERQVSRLHVVGSSAFTSQLIESSYLRLLDILEKHFSQHAFLMGKRPGASDFALYGQLSQLAQFDPTPMAITCERAPRVVAWTQLMEDLSGLEPRSMDWMDDQYEIPPTLRALLSEAGRTYAPVMLANEAAVGQGIGYVVTTVDGQEWSQKAFPYQAKCLGWLRREFNLLEAKNQRLFLDLIKVTGCDALFL